MPSSVITWMRYEARRRSLLVSFRQDRGLYRYFDVPEEIWSAFRTAPSKGTFLNTQFKEGGYGFERVEQAPGPRLVARLDDPNFWGDRT